MLVLFFHGQAPGFGYGYIGVDIFFVLSGYLITTILVREYELTKSISFINFYRRRTLRLLPALALMSVLFIAYSAMFLPRFEERLRETFEALTYVSNWARALQLGHTPYLGHTWSLGVEEQFYLAWPMVLFATLHLRDGQRIAPWVALGIAAAASLWRISLALHGVNAQYLLNGFDTRCDSVLIGSALAFFAPHVRFFWPIGVIGLLIPLLFFRWDNSVMLMGGYTAVAASAAVVIAGAVQSDGVLYKLLSVAPLVAIGRISYGLYLYHFPIYEIGINQFGWGPLYLNTLALGLTIALAIASYRFLERPCLKFGHTSDSGRAKFLAYVGPVSLTVGAAYIAWILSR